MAFGSKVNDAIDLFVLHELVESVKIADVHLHELVVRFVFDILEVCKVARVSELVEVDDFVFRILVDKKTNDMAPNKASTACNHNGTFHEFLQLYKDNIEIVRTDSF